MAFVLTQCPQITWRATKTIRFNRNQPVIDELDQEHRLISAGSQFKWRVKLLPDTRSKVHVLTSCQDIVSVDADVYASLQVSHVEIMMNAPKTNAVVVNQRPTQKAALATVYASASGHTSTYGTPGR
jgi:hypothetical protein